MATYPCRFYGADPHGSEEFVYALRLSAPAPEDVWRALLDELWGIPGKVFAAPDDPEQWWFEEATEDPGRIDVALDGEWALTYQNVGDPMHSLDSVVPYVDAFRAHAERLGATEILALFGQLPGYDYDIDPWTAWSLEQALPSRVVTSDGRVWASPWDEYESLLG